MARGQGGGQPGPQRKGLPHKPCKVEGCRVRAVWHGLCEEHYPPARICSVEGCERSHYARRLCAMHYRRAVRGQELGGPELRRRVRPVAQCSTPGCDQLGIYYGLCARHRYKRVCDGLNLADSVPSANREPAVGEE